MTKFDLMIFGWENEFTYPELLKVAEREGYIIPTPAEYAKFCIEQDREIEDYFETDSIFDVMPMDSFVGDDE